MYFTVLTPLLTLVMTCFANVRTTGPEHHSLYEYTCVYKLPSAMTAIETGVYEFTFYSLFDGQNILYFDSKGKEMIPRLNWMKEKLPADYWRDGKNEESWKNEEQWLKVQLDRVIVHMGLNVSSGHVFIRKRGCEVEKMPNGSVNFVISVDGYGYNGNDFLSFDRESLKWKGDPEALPIKKDWDELTKRNQYIKGYLEKECVDWLKIFIEYGEQDIKEELKASPPTVHLFTKHTRSPDKRTLTCMITGLYPRGICISILKRGTPISKSNISDVLPNGDGTHQARLSVEAEKSGINDYRCEVNHSGLEKPIVRLWPSDGELIYSGGSSSIWIICAVGGGIFVLVLVGVIVYKIQCSDGGLQYNGCRGETEVPGPGNGLGEREIVPLNILNGHIEEMSETDSGRPTQSNGSPNSGNGNVQ